MVHEVTQYDADLPTIEDAFAGDDRTIALKVVDADGNGIDISPTTIRWELYERAYQTNRSESVLDDGDSSVDVVTSSPVDPTVGEFEVQLDSDATDDLWGEYFHRPEVEQKDGTIAKWRGRLVIEA